MIFKFLFTYCKTDGLYNPFARKMGKKTKGQFEFKIIVYLCNREQTIFNKS